MPTLLRHPRFSQPAPEPLDVPRLLKESEALDLAEQAEQNSAWFEHQAKLGQALKDLAELALALAGVGAVVVGLWLAKAWG